MSKKRKSRKTRRSVTKPMPPRIDAAPEEIAQVVLGVKPPKKWRYLDGTSDDWGGEEGIELDEVEEAR